VLIGFQQNGFKTGRVQTLHFEIHKLKMIWNKEELLHQWKESIIVHIPKRVIILIAVIIEA
jgi:hypothetical protein